MAKARDVDGLLPRTPYALAAARTVRVRADELFEHADGVLSTDDPGRVHDMRVATRRLRAVLELYAPCFPSRELRPVLRDVRRLADALGARRDPDVQLAAVAAFARGAGEPEQAGLEVVSDAIRARQSAGNEQLAAALAQVAASDLRGRLLVLADVAAERVHVA
jgi:CHAD domain-containing protein